MMHSKGKWLITAGVVLVLLSLAVILLMQINDSMALKKSRECAAHIKEILPPIFRGSKDSYHTMEMPSLEFDGRDIIGLLEIETADTVLVLESRQDNRRTALFPRRFSGTVYDDSLIVEGKDRKGQFDCLEKLDIGNTVTVTDMTGACFSYIVDRIERQKSVDADALDKAEADLVLFTFDNSCANYIIVYCV